MRILYVVHQFMPDFAGGTERVTLNLAHAAQADGAHVEILTATADGARWREGADGLFTQVVEGVPVTAVRIAEPPLTELGFFENPDLRAKAEAFLRGRPEFDVAHVMHAFRLVEAVEVLAERHVPYIVTTTDFFSLCYRINLVRLNGELCDGPRDGEACRTWCRQEPLAEDERYVERTRRLAHLLHAASAVAAVSDYVAGRLRDEHPDLKVFVVRNGVDLVRFGRPRPRNRRGARTVGYLGTVSQAKGALMLARAFAAAEAPNLKLRIVGPCYEPAVAEEIRELAARAPMTLEKAIPPTAAPALLARFDVLAVPSQVPESFGLSLHEGFAAGLPTLVSDLGNQGEVIRQTGAGLALPAADLAAWSAALRDISERPEQLRAWAQAVPLPWRVEEEAFLYSQLYRAAVVRA
ncbi:glycosyltransferase [Phenylobacterium sp.]|jgi:glycosyltransferase involved in cell wall biosynthesis|uniref:glycosyltransferase n=1 Tax=Phenylobacterium sp. TaxID=1871053 RepID=UPI002F954F13